MVKWLNCCGEAEHLLFCIHNFSHLLKYLILNPQFQRPISNIQFVGALRNALLTLTTCKQEQVVGIRLSNNGCCPVVVFTILYLCYSRIESE